MIWYSKYLFHEQISPKYSIAHFSNFNCHCLHNTFYFLSIYLPMPFSLPPFLLHSLVLLIAVSSRNPFQFYLFNCFFFTQNVVQLTAQFNLCQTNELAGLSSSHIQRHRFANSPSPSSSVYCNQCIDWFSLPSSPYSTLIDSSYTPTMHYVTSRWIFYSSTSYFSNYRFFLSKFEGP